MPRAVRVLRLFLTVATGACARPGTLNTSGPFDIARAPSEGLRYYVTRDLLTIDAKVSTYRAMVRGSGGVCEPRDSMATSWTLTATTVPDRRQAYRLGLQPSATVDQTLGVKVSETGVLTSLNYAGADQRGAIVTTVAKGVAGLLAGFTRGGGLTASRDTSCAAALRAKPVLASTRHVLRTFDLTELPPAPDPGASWPSVAQQFASFTRDIELFSTANIYLTISQVPEPTTALETPGVAHGDPIGCSGADSVCARIFYREPIMRVIRVHVPERIDTRPSPLAVAEERIVPLVSAADPILNVSFGTQTLGAGKIALKFGDHGNITGVEQTSTAALAGAASATASVTAGARDAYLAALKARVEMLDLELKTARDNAAIHNAQASDTLTTIP